MLYRAMFIGGALFLAIALIFGSTLLWHNSQAEALGSFTKALSGEACQHPIDYISPPQLVMSTNDTQSIEIHLLNKGRSACKLEVKLDAPNFKPSSDVKVISLQARQKDRVTWILTPPDRPGDFQIQVIAALD